MVSSLSQLIRPRRDRHGRNKKKNGVIPEIKIDEADSLVSVTDSSQSDMSGATTVVEEIVVEYQKVLIKGTESGAESVDNGVKIVEETKIITVVETDEVVQPHSLCSLNDSLEKVKEAVDQIPGEVKEAAKYSGLATISFTVLFVLVVLYRVLKHFFYDEQDGFFCKYFAHPFHPMFDALCDEHADFYTEFWAQCSILGDEISGAFNGIIKMFQDGCHAFACIYWHMFGGIYESLRYGLHEMTENVSENVSFLFNFCINLVDHFYNMIVHVLTACSQHITEIFESIKRKFNRDEPEYHSWW